MYKNINLKAKKISCVDETNDFIIVSNLCYMRLIRCYYKIQSFIYNITKFGYIFFSEQKLGIEESSQLHRVNTCTTYTNSRRLAPTSTMVK